MSNRNKIIGLLMVLALCMFACKSKKGLTSSEKQEFSSLEYNTFSSSKATFTIAQDQKSFNVNGAIRIRKDSLIMISIQPFLGMEVARATMTQNDFTILDRIHKKYFSASFADLSKDLGVEINYHLFQSILTNALFEYDKNETPKLSDFKKAKVMDLMMLQYSKGKILQEFTVDSEYRVQSASLFADGEPYSLRWSYTKFNALETGYFFPHQISFTLNDGKKNNQLDIEYKKIDINKDLNFDFTVPSSYKAVTLDELMQMLK